MTKFEIKYLKEVLINLKTIKNSLEYTYKINNIIEELEELIKEFETKSKVSGLIDLSQYSLNDLLKLLLNKKGNIILSNQRDNPFMCYISLDNNYHLLTENVLNNLITVVSYDAFNYKKFEE